VQVRHGEVQLPAGFSLIWVKHRHGRHQATPQIALLEGWGELRGAIATSYSHDSHNLVVLGRDAEDMALAANRLIASGGGMALRRGRFLPMWRCRLPACSPICRRPSWRGSSASCAT
jgi:adenine deaminase